MIRKTHLLRCAGSAIAAALALGSIPVLAQDVIAPTVTAPPPVASAPPQPAATVPPPAPAGQAPVMVSNPVVQDTPAEIVPPDLPQVTEAEEAPAEAAPVAARETTTPRRAAGAEPQATAPVAAPASQSEAVTTPVAPAEMPDTPVAETADVAEPASEPSYGLLAGLLAALGIVVLAGWGFVAIGRRRKFAQAAVPVVERPVVAERQPQPAPLPAAPAPAAASASVTPLASPRAPVHEPAMAHSGAAVALPRELPTTFAERDALLRRMIEAKPDRANPFRSPKARARRARLILQSLGRDFGEADPRIDLGQYAGNWPELARRKSAVA